MTVLLDSSVLIDVLRDFAPALRFLSELEDEAISSEICRVEVLQGLRPAEEANAAALFSLLEWVPVGEPISTLAGELGRRWRPSHSGISAPDLIVAATAELTGSALQTLNLEHFPMISGLVRPY